VRRHIRFAIVPLYILPAPALGRGGGEKHLIQPSDLAAASTVSSPPTPSAPPTFHNLTDFGSGVTILSDTRGVDFRQYIIRLLNKWKPQWLAEMAEDARMGENGRVTIQFRICPTARLL
jgi:hypothetical protein